jgi:hypothetical protein
LLWDKIEYIIPDDRYQPHYPNQLLAEAAQIVAKPHLPTAAEKKSAHEQIEDLATSSLPDAFFFQQTAAYGDYEIYPQKFLQQTWDLLHNLQLAGDPRANADFPLSRPAGLSVMSILADCCAGKTRARVTDQGSAYATISNLLQGVSTPRGSEEETKSRETFVSIGLETVNLSKIPLRRLIDFRMRERKASGHAYRDLRHRFVDRMEAYVDTITKTKGNQTDADNLSGELAEALKDDLATLRDELGFARNDVIFSKEMITAAVAGLGTIAAFAFGAPMLVEGVVTLTGAPVTIGGLLSSRNKYLATRRSVLQKHPMAYLYELQSF